MKQEKKRVMDLLMISKYFLFMLCIIGCSYENSYLTTFDVFDLPSSNNSKYFSCIENLSSEKLNFYLVREIQNTKIINDNDINLLLSKYYKYIKRITTNTDCSYIKCFLFYLFKYSNAEPSEKELKTILKLSDNSCINEQYNKLRCLKTYSYLPCFYYYASTNFKNIYIKKEMLRILKRIFNENNDMFSYFDIIIENMKFDNIFKKSAHIDKGEVDMLIDLGLIYGYKYKSDELLFNLGNLFEKNISNVASKVKKIEDLHSIFYIFESKSRQNKIRVTSPGLTYIISKFSYEIPYSFFENGEFFKLLIAKAHNFIYEKYFLKKERLPENITVQFFCDNLDDSFLDEQIKRYCKHLPWLQKN